jgi:hypothetical protein
MERTVIGHFSTRRDAELAIEHVVQEHGVARNDVFVQAAGADNSAGTRAAGADRESGHPGVEKHGSPELKGDVEVSVDCHDVAKARAVKVAFEQAGGHEIKMC